MSSTSLVALDKLDKELDQLCQDKKTGELILENHHRVIGEVYFCAGRLLYATENHHRVRRFLRAIKKNCPEWKYSNVKLSADFPWEYELIFEGIKEKKLNLPQIKGLISSVLLEFLFELNTQTEVTTKWQEKLEQQSGFSLYLTLSYKEFTAIRQEVEQLESQWHQANLSFLRPYLSPCLKPGANADSFPILLKYLHGQHTIWDIALELKKSITEVAHYLLPLIGKNMVQLKDLPDLATPFKTDQPQVTKSRSENIQNTTKVDKKGLIACIDDSPVVAYNLKKILTPLGYEILTIEEPMHGFGTLIENKPDLIFLDLNMPNAHGYSVCQFLRNSPVFHNTPIIILTAHDTVIDRGRAKMVGATDFIGKPAEPKQVVELLARYLGK